MEYASFSGMTYPNTRVERPVTNESRVVQDVPEELDDVLRNESRVGALGGPSEQALADVKSAVIAKLVLAVGKDPGAATDRDWFLAAAFAIRDRIIHRWLA